MAHKYGIKLLKGCNLANEYTNFFQAARNLHLLTLLPMSLYKRYFAIPISMVNNSLWYPLLTVSTNNLVVITGSVE